MPSPADQLAVERAAQALAVGDPIAEWLKAPDTQGRDRTWMLVKMVMRAVALFLGVAGLVLTVMAVDLMTLPFTVLCTLWNATEFLTMGIRRDFRRGVTPKAHVGADLVLWIFAGFLFGNDCSSIAARMARLSPTSSLLGFETAMTGLLLLLHFVLFVRACVEVDRQKKSRRIQKLVLALQARGRLPGEAPQPMAVLASETSLPKGSSKPGRSEASSFSHRAQPPPPPPVDSPVGVDPRALNAKYDPEAMKLVRELDVLEAQKVLGSVRVVERR